MAAHRKPKQRPYTGTAARTAAALAFAGAATAAALPGSAHADPQRTPAQVEADRLYHDAEVATEKYNGAKERATAAAEAVDVLRDEAARRTERLNAARDALGSFAAAQYRSGGLDPAVQLALSSDPDQYLERASYLDRIGERRAAEVDVARRQVARIAQLRVEAGKRLAELEERRAELKKYRAAIRARLTEARRLLATLSPSERAAYAGADGAHSGARADRDLARGPIQAPNARAAAAIAFAFGALGKPYVWGATGPSSYDCSGLTQAAWRAAGVSLPRTTYTQIEAGRRVSRSELAPGDLVFFFSGVSHVGLYIGNGRMIHAPRPGAPVKIAPIDQMPFAGATRVA